jgi:hypothetical protein
MRVLACSVYGYHVFLLLDSGCSHSVVLFVLTTAYGHGGYAAYVLWGSREGSGYILIGTVVGVCLVCFIYYCEGYVFIIRSNMELCVFAKVSFICNLRLLKLCMWNSSRVFSYYPFFSVRSNSNVWLIAPYACPVSSICRAYFEFCFFAFVAWICS